MSFSVKSKRANYRVLKDLNPKESFEKHDNWYVVVSHDTDTNSTAVFCFNDLEQTVLSSDCEVLPIELILDRKRRKRQPKKA